MRLDISFIHRVASSLTIVAVISISLLLFGCGGVETPVDKVPTGSVTLSWQTPTTNNDGTPLLDLAGYKIYYGSTPDASDFVVNITDPNITEVNIGGLTLERWYYTITAYNTFQHESERSSIIDTVATAD